jgi:hypothetical protein
VPAFLPSYFPADTQMPGVFSEHTGHSRQ